MHRTVLHYGHHQALQGIDLAVQEGARIGIRGADEAALGALVNLLAALQNPDQGSVRIDGENTARMTQQARLAYRRNLGLLVRGWELIDNLSLLENGLYALDLAKAQCAQPPAREVGEILRQAGFTDVHQSVNTLTSAQRIRAGWARAVVHRPKIVLCLGRLWKEESSVLACIRGLWEQLPPSTAIVMASSEPLPSRLPIQQQFILSNGELH